jgi:16S rRNA processing protein RimM
VKGELKLKFDAELLGSITSLNPLFFAVEKNYLPYFTEQLRLRENGEAIARLEDIKSKEEAQVFVNKPVFIEEKNIDSSYLDENHNFLIGFTAKDKQKESIGVIDDIFDMPANKLARIMRDGKEILIPLHKDFIISINKSKKEICFDLPEGLLNL